MRDLAASNADLEPMIAPSLIAQNHHVGEGLAGRIMPSLDEEHQRPRAHGRAGCTGSILVELAPRASPTVKPSARRMLAQPGSDDADVRVGAIDTSSSITICIIGRAPAPLAGCHDGHGACGAKNRRKAPAGQRRSIGMPPPSPQSPRASTRVHCGPDASVGPRVGPSKATADPARSRLYNVRRTNGP